jgi:hypothetical protein
VTALDEKRLRERHLFRTINKCLLGSILVGGFFAVIAASGGMKSQGQTLDRTGSALGVMAMFLGVSLALTIVLVVRFALRERRLGTRRAKSPLKPSNV